jgi:hypothetical protein
LIRAPASVVVERIRQIVQLRDDGQITDDETLRAIMRVLTKGLE